VATTIFFDDTARNRYELHAEGVLVAVLTYERSDDGVISLLHAETDPARRGEGLAAVLVAHVLDEARDHRLQVLPRCSYVREFIAERPDAYGDLVPAARREEFGLSRQ
jgi:uncharacterized protein